MQNQQLQRALNQLFDSKPFVPPPSLKFALALGLSMDWIGLGHYYFIIFFELIRTQPDYIQVKRSWPYLTRPM
jgi:hypothetical protein